MINAAIKTFLKFKIIKSSCSDRKNVFYVICKLHLLVIAVIFLAVTSIAASSDPNISILWEREITQADCGIAPYTIKIENENIIRIIGVSYTRQTKESPKPKNPKLFEYRINLKDNKSETKPLLSMDGNDITVTSLQGNIIDSRLINDNIAIIRNQYKSFNFQELTIGNDWQVKTREIPGITRLSGSTLGACRNVNGDVFLCGNSGYIRKVKSDGNVAWDINYKSDKGEDGTLSVAFSESDKMLVAFGFSFTPDTKFTTKNSSLWLANLDSKGNFKAKTEFEGIVNFGKFPSFCLGTSDNPIVIYDNNTVIGSYKIYVSKFSKDLNRKAWTTPIFNGKDMMIPRMSLTPFGKDYTLAAFDSLIKKSINLYFYILDKNGNIVNQAIFEDISIANYLVTVSKDKIFLVTDGYRRENNKTIGFAKLICFKINSHETQSN